LGDGGLLLGGGLRRGGLGGRRCGDGGAGGDGRGDADDGGGGEGAGHAHRALLWVESVQGGISGAARRGRWGGNQVRRRRPSSGPAPAAPASSCSRPTSSMRAARGPVGTRRMAVSPTRSTWRRSARAGAPPPPMRPVIWVSRP